MARIETPYGDLETAVKITDGLMQVAVLTFSVPLSHALVQAGAFNLWQQCDVFVWDGDTEAGSQRTAALAYTCYVTNPQRNDGQLDVELHDASIWLQRRDAVRVTSAAKTAGNHISDFFATVLDNAERRSPQGYTISGSSVWSAPAVPFTGAPPGIQATAASSGVSASDRQFVYPSFPFTTTAAPVGVRVHLYTQVSTGAVWSNTLEVSVDGGSTWLAAHAVAVDGAPRHIWVDVFGDTTWTSAMLVPGLVQLRLTVLSAATDTAQWWAVNIAEIEVTTATSVDSFPVILGDIDLNGPVITLPATERKTYLDWFSWIADQTGYEWATIPYDVGIAAFSWKPRVGVDVDVIQSVVFSGAGSEILSLEEGQLLTSPIRSAIDGLALYSRVRVTAPGLADVVQTNATLAALIGIHSITIDLGPGATATDQANTAAQKLKELASPAMHLQVQVARVPALWGVLGNGNTVIVNLKAAPVKRWQGVCRIVSRAIDDAGGTMQLDILTVQDLGSSSIAVGDGGVKVQAPVNTRKATPAAQRKKKFITWIDLARRVARQ